MQFLGTLIYKNKCSLRFDIMLKNLKAVAMLWLIKFSWIIIFWKGESSANFLIDLFWGVQKVGYKFPSLFQRNVFIASKYQWENGPLI